MKPLSRSRLLGAFSTIVLLLVALSLSFPAAASVWTHACGGDPWSVKTVFDKSEFICVAGTGIGGGGVAQDCGFLPCADIYVMSNRTWAGGEALADALGSENRVQAETSGAGFGLLDDVILVTPAKAMVGEYDIILDNNLSQPPKYDGNDEVNDLGPGFAFKIIDLGHPPVDVSSIKTAAKGMSQGASDAIDQWNAGCNALDALGVGLSLMSGDVVGAAIGVLGNITGIPTDYNGAVISKATELIGAFDPNSSPQKASGIYGNLAKHWYDLYEDPPDPNFTVFAALNFASINAELAASSVAGAYPFQAKGSDPREAVLIRIANRSVEQASLVKALRQSYEKYQGAAAASNYEYAFRQIEQARQYGEWLAGNMSAMRNDLQNVTSVFAAYGVADKVYKIADMQALKDRVTASGLTAEEIQSLKNVGFSDARIQLLTQYVKAIKVPAADFSLSSSVNDLVAQIDTALPGVQAFNASALSTMTNLVSEFAPHHPVVDAGGPYSGVAGSQIALNGGSSSDPDVGDTLTYDWDLNGDGVFTDASGKTVLYTWSKPYSGLIGLKVTDSTNRSSIGYAQVIISAGNAPPVISSFSPAASSPSASVLQPLTFTVAASDPDNDPLTYEWTVDGVPVGTNTSYTLTPGSTENGTKLVLVTIRDNNAASADTVEGKVVRIYADADGDGYDSSVDCNDNDPTVHPGATEILGNGKDDDCNAATPDFLCGGQPPLTFFRDADGDGFGNPALSVSDCSAPAGYVSNDTDCNDSDPAIHPGATEICNGKDDNCNGQVDEGVTAAFFADADVDGYGTPLVSVQACFAPAGYVTNSTDCNDASAAINPGATEILYDGIDNDCNPATPDGIDADGDGYTNNLDCNDSDPGVNPGRKEIIHNGKDDDCNAATMDNWSKSFVIASDDAANIYYAKSNGDGTFSNYKSLGQYSSSYGRGVVIEDFNNDGFLDFIAGSSSGSMYLFLNDGTDNFANTGIVGTHPSAGSYVTGMSAGDFNNDGLMDFVADANSTTIAIFLSDGMGGFTRSTLTGTGNGRGLDLADFNGDGNLDFMRAASTTGVWLYAGNGDGTFTGSNIGTVPTTENYALAAADFDNDGKVDAIVGGNSSGNPYFLKGNGNGSFQAATLVPSLDTTTYNALAAYDLNSDGKIDIVMANYTGRGILFYPGNGDGTFGAPVTINTSLTSTNILAISTPPTGNPAGFPVAEVKPKSQTIHLGESANLDGTFSFDADGSLTAWNWKFGDGTAGTGASASHAYTAEGIFGASLTVTDNVGKKDTDTARVTVLGNPPVANAGGPYTFGESYASLGVYTVTLNGSGSTDDFGIASYLWDFGTPVSDSFAGTVLDTTKWIASTGVSQNEKAAITGNGSWGQRYLFSQKTVMRDEGTTFEFKVKTTTATTQRGMFGVKDTGSNYSYTQMPHAFYFYDGSMYIYEGGTSRGVVATYTRGIQYELKLVLKATGAYYYMRESGKPFWQLIYNSTYSNLATLKFGATILNDTFELDDVKARILISGPTPTKKLLMGSYDVTLTVTDNVGQTSSAATTVTTIPGAPPVTNTGGPYTFGENVASQNKWTTALDGSGSTDDIGIVSYSWDFGDGSAVSTVAKPTHVYTGPGPYTATLTVTDNVGQSHSASTTVTLTGNVFPVANPSGPYTVPETQVVNKHWSISVSAAASTDDFGIWKYSWDFGDGSAAVTTSTATHTYATLGPFTVKLTVTDNANQSHTATTTAYVTGTPAVAKAGGPYAGEPNAPIKFDGSGSSDDLGIISYAWDFGDGTTAKGAKPEHTYTTPGTYTVILTVTDQTLQPSTDTTSAIVAVGSPPLANAGGPYTTNVDLPFRLDGTRSTDDGGIISYAWTVGTPTVVLQDSFNGTTIDASKWLYSTGLTQNGAITSTGSIAWGSRYLFSSYTFDTRGSMEFQGQVSSTATGNMMIGFKNSGTNYSYTQMPYAIYFNSGTFSVYEDGIARTLSAPAKTYSLNIVYDVKVVLKENANGVIAGARYYYKPATATDWIILYDSNYVTAASTLKAGATFSSGTFFIDNLQVAAGLQRATGAQPVLTFDVPGTFPVQLTVTDGAGQTSSATTTLTVSPDPAVITVPWQFSGGIEVPHDTWSGEEVILKAVVKSRRAPLTFVWDFGDGTTATGTVSNKYDVSARHTYTAADGTPVVARLTVTDADGRTSSDTFPIIMRSKSLDVEVNKAIEDGLWYLHTTQDRTLTTTDGRWSGYSSYYSSPTASALHAMEINGHLEVGDFRNDPYVEDVWRGMRYLLTAIRQGAISDQAYGDPDLNGNGIGIEVTDGNPIYQGGQVMMALVASSTPDMKAEVGGVGIKGRTYKQIVEDMAEMYYWGQQDSATAGGGWRYSWNSDADNSACQWAALGFEAAEEQNWIKVPQWVKDRNLVWLNYSRGSGGIGYGYASAGNGEATSPSGLAQLAFDGVPTSDDRWKKTENYLAQNWNTWYGNKDNYYAFYALAKAMRIAKPQEVIIMGEGTANAIDWYSDPTRGLARTIVNDQDINGQFVSSAGYVTGAFKTAWGVIILTKTLFVLPPVAIAGDNKVWGVDWELTFDGSKSYHLDPFRKIVKYEWDFDGDGTFDSVSDQPTAVHTYSSADYPVSTLPKTFTVTLRVTDNNDPPKYDTDTVSIIIAEPPHPPVAVPGGPYIGYVGIPLQFDGSKSYDIDPSDVITSYGWEIDGVYPYNFTDATGAKPMVTFTQPGTYNIGLQVFDNGVLSPGDAKLSDTKWTTVTIRLNNPPVANPGGPYTVNEGSSITIDAGGSTDPDGNPLTYAWDLDNNGTYETTGITATFTKPDNGSFTVGLKVTDGALESTANVVVNVANVPPLVGPIPMATINEGGTYVGSGFFTDPGADTWTATVDYGDGTGPQPLTLNPDKSFNLSHTYPQNGSYTVTVTVTDDDGGSGNNAAAPTVLNVAPVVNAGPDGSLSETGTFSSSGSFTDPGDTDTWTATVDYGDGSGEQNLPLAGKSFSLSRMYPQSGSYTITVKITDSDGGTGTDTVLVNVANVAPTVDAGPDKAISEDGTFSSAGSFNDPGVNDTWTATVDYGDGTGQQPLPLNPDKTFTLSHTYAQSGSYTVTVKVSDSDGGTGTDAVLVNVANVSPVVNAGPDMAISEGGTFSSAGSFTDPGVNDTWTATVDYGDGTGQQPLPLNPGKTFALSHTYAQSGSYTVTVKVTDSDGDTGSDTALVAVGNVPPSVDAGPDKTINEGGTFTGAGSFVDPGAVSWTATVDYGDGSGTQNLPLGSDNTFILNHQYAQDGIYAVTVTVTDSDGAAGSGTATVTVNNIAPVVNAGPDASINAGGTFSSTGSFTDPGADTWTATVNYGDGTGPQPLALNADKTFALGHTYATQGTYTVAVTVQDNNSATGSDTAVVTVNALTCSISNLTALPKSGVVQLRWSGLTGLQYYDIYRSTDGPDTGFTVIAPNYATQYQTYQDRTVVNGTTYYYKVALKGANGCMSASVGAKPVAVVR